MMGGIMGIFVALFGVYWTILAWNAFPPFAIFGVIFIIVAVVQAVYNFKNATSKNRYSAFDITTEEEEIDPLNERFGRVGTNTEPDSEFCPYCGTPVAGDYTYCNKCGKKLP